MFQLIGEGGSQLDARFSVDQTNIILHSRGGTKGRRGAANADYGKALLLVTRRLTQAAIPILGAWVDSATVQSRPLKDRAVLAESEGSLSPEQICSLMSARMKVVRDVPNPNAKGGNSTKRIRIATGFGGTSEDLAVLLGGMAVEGNARSMERLPAEVLRSVTPEHVFRAVQQFIERDEWNDSFGESTDYDLIADDGRRLPPKAVFGLALSMALDGAPIEPKHFTAGGLCFTLLREAGYQVVKKGEISSAPDTEISIDKEWREGDIKLRSHLKRERAPGLANAKKAQYRRVHDGRLTCEQCGLDPVERYKTRDAEACIEVHHSAVQVSKMPTDHKTTLDDLQCLCANCHRLLHKRLRAGKRNARG
jgi:5-methylcytosine-specific restriction protein A